VTPLTVRGCDTAAATLCRTFGQSRDHCSRSAASSAPGNKNGTAGEQGDGSPAISALLTSPVLLENRIRLLACSFAVASCGSAVFVDQAAQYRFSVNSLGIEVGCGDPGNFVVTAGNPLGDALVRLGRVVVGLVLDQDGAQMRLAEDQHAVEELAAQGADEAFAGRVGRRRRLHPVQMIGTGVSG
jgi:hypothetical protein